MALLPQNLFIKLKTLKMKKILLFVSLFLANNFFCQSVNNVSIQVKDIMVLYAGIPHTFNASAMGFKEVKVNVPNPYIPSVDNIGQYVSINCTGITKKGKEIQLPGYKYLIKPAPIVELFWGENTDNDIVDLTRPLANNLKIGYPDNIALVDSNFVVESYSISVEGLKGVLQGEGNEISELHLQTLLSLSSNQPIISIMVKYSGSKSGTRTSSFKF
jgi:hypothetical protein